MTTNRLAVSTGGRSVRSGKAALQWAQSARDRGQLDVAAKWEQAHRDGWNDTHFDPAVREQHIGEAAAWAGKKGLLTNRSA